MRDVNTFGQHDICTPICGDGFKLYPEACDDGNTANYDGCDSACNIETTHTCSNSTMNGTSTCIPICGDGFTFPL